MVANVLVPSLGPWRAMFIYLLNMQFLSKNLISISANSSLSGRPYFLLAQVQRRMVEIFSIHQSELSSLKRDLYMSR
jgi:hypothetical protein